MISEDFLFQLPNPQVYTGKEINIVRKSHQPGDIRICLAFPDVYEIGMSHSGIKILYHFLNGIPGVVAERAFLPERSGIGLFHANGVPLFSLENRLALDQFDIIGVSLMSELNFTNLLLLLDLAGIPLKAADRTNDHPLIIAGGISTANPEPIRHFVDGFAIGDGEALFPEIINVLRNHRGKKSPRPDILKDLDGIDGFYVPACHPLTECGSFLVPQMDGKSVRKRVMQDFHRFAYEEKEIVPITNVVFNRLSVEIARGCPHKCRFCQARAYYAPYRIRGKEDSLRFIRRALDLTGYEAFSLSSLSTGDYPHLPGLLENISGMTGPDISFSVPSLRPSVLSGLLLDAISLHRRTGITIVPEAGTMRLRRSLDKDVSDEEIFRAVDLALTHGWQRIKMYFMIGLPGETQEDMEAIASLVKKANQMCREKRKKVHFHVSFSPFVPKPHTPFQWMKMDGVPALVPKIHLIRSELKHLRNVELDFHSPQKAVIETILARGDARTGELLLQAYQKGETFTSWEDGFHFPVWQELMETLHQDFLLREFPLDTVFPWDFLTLDRKKDILQKEFCTSLEILHAPFSPADSAASFSGPASTARQPLESKNPQPSGSTPKACDFVKIRIFYEKKGDFRFFSHLSLMQYVERLLRKTGLRFKCTEGFHPRFKLSFLPPLPVGARGDNEVLEAQVESGRSEDELLKLLQRQSESFRFNRVQVCPGRPSLGKDIQTLCYDIRISGVPIPMEQIKALLLPEERMSIHSGIMSLRLHFAEKGPERLARIYRLLDPEKKRVRDLTRCGVEFADEKN